MKNENNILKYYVYVMLCTFMFVEFSARMEMLSLEINDLCMPNLPVDIGTANMHLNIQKWGLITLQKENGSKNIKNGVS